MGEVAVIGVVGHRGAAGLAPENTLKGFRLAIDLGVDRVECDVQLTRDERLVVIHDDTVDRTTDGSGRVGALDFDVIRGLDAGDGERVPTLEEVLATVQGRVGLLCELKGEGVEEAAVEAVAARGMAGEVLFTSFNIQRLAKVRQRGHFYQLGALFKDPTDAEVACAVDLGVAEIDVLYKNLCLRVVDLMHGAGIRVRAWNPDTWRDQKAMIALGVDSVSTNRPDILLEHLGRRRGVVVDPTQ